MKKCFSFRRRFHLHIFPHDHEMTECDVLKNENGRILIQDITQDNFSPQIDRLKIALVG